MNTALRGLLAALLMIVGASWSSQALAWGDSGHRTVCEIALRNLTPVARAEVTRLLQANPVILGANPLNAEYGWACTYPDHPAAGAPAPLGRRSPAHFANYARTTMAVTGPDCGGATICVVSAIATDFATLRATTASDADRAAALVYLGHWLGDIHQPLHSSFADDRGGNEVNARGLCTSSLHSTWDTCILQTRALAGGRSIEDVRALAGRWSDQVTADQRTAWVASDPWQWSAESYTVTLRSDTGYCVMVGPACQYSATNMSWAEGERKRPVQIDAAYMDWAMPIIQARITQAGVRLANLLNRALDPAYRG